MIYILHITILLCKHPYPYTYMYTSLLVCILVYKTVYYYTNVYHYYIGIPMCILVLSTTTYSFELENIYIVCLPSNIRMKSNQPNRATPQPQTKRVSKCCGYPLRRVEAGEWYCTNCNELH